MDILRCLSEALVERVWLTSENECLGCGLSQDRLPDEWEDVGGEQSTDVAFLDALGAKKAGAARTHDSKAPFRSLSALSDLAMQFGLRDVKIQSVFTAASACLDESPKHGVHHPRHGPGNESGRGTAQVELSEGRRKATPQEIGG